MVINYKRKLNDTAYDINAGLKQIEPKENLTYGLKNFIFLILILITLTMFIFKYIFNFAFFLSRSTCPFRRGRLSQIKKKLCNYIINYLSLH